MFSGQAVLLRSSVFHKSSYITSQTFGKIPISCKSDIPLKVKASRQSNTVMDGEEVERDLLTQPQSTGIDTLHEQNSSCLLCSKSPRCCHSLCLERLWELEITSNSQRCGSSQPRVCYSHPFLPRIFTRPSHLAVLWNLRIYR